MIDPKEASNLTAASQETVKTIARLKERANKLEYQLSNIRCVIPVGYLKAHDTPGAVGPTENLDLQGAVRAMTEDGRRLQSDLDLAKAENMRLHARLGEIGSEAYAITNPANRYPSLQARADYALKYVDKLSEIASDKDYDAFEGFIRRSIEQKAEHVRLRAAIDDLSYCLFCDADMSEGHVAHITGCWYAALKESS